MIAGDSAERYRGLARAVSPAGNAPVLVTSPSRKAVLWASRACEAAFGSSLPDEITPTLFGTPSSRAFAARLSRLSPGDGEQLERIVIRSAFQLRPATLICCAVASEGETLTVMRVVAPWIEDLPASDAAQDEPEPLSETAPEPEAVDDTPAAAPQAATPIEAVANRLARHFGDLSSVRFLWECDRDGRLTKLGPELAVCVGASAPDVGHSLTDAVAAFDAASAATIQTAFAHHRSWSGLLLHWPVANEVLALPVSLNGAALSGATAGFRGFGSIHLRDIQVWDPPTALATEPDPGEPAPIEEQDEASAPAAAEAPVAEGVAPTAPEGGVETTSAADPQPQPVDTPLPDQAAVSPDDSSHGHQPSALAAVPVAPELPSRREGHSGPDLSKVVNLLTFKAASIPALQIQPNRPRPVPHEVPKASEDLAPPEAPLWSESPDGDASSAPSVLTHAERFNLHEIRRTLTQDLPPVDPTLPHPAEDVPNPAFVEPEEAFDPPSAADDRAAEAQETGPAPASDLEETAAPAPHDNGSEALLERLPLALVVLKEGVPAFANRAALDEIGFRSVDELRSAGGLGFLLGDEGRPADGMRDIKTASGGQRRAHVRLQPIGWDGGPATLLSIRGSDDEADARTEAVKLDLRRSQAQVNDLDNALEAASTGVVVLDLGGRIQSLNHGAEQFFGYHPREVVGDDVGLFLTADQHAAWAELLASLQNASEPACATAHARLVGRKRDGEVVQLGVRLRRLAGDRLCVVFNDETPQKEVEHELEAARREAERSSTLKSEFLAKVSHEIRTPLNAILGFAEVMRDERLGPIGNDRYKDYLRDIHASGTHVMSLINDLLDLSRIEAGRLDLKLVGVNVNAIVGECVGTLQNQANRERVIMRLSLSPRLPPILADERALRQIVLNLLSNAVKFNEPGGQVIVSTALVGSGGVAVRIRDTGFGMSDEDIATAMEPFRQLATPKASVGSGLGLPLTKALVDASQASMAIKSRPREGTLVEVVFQQAEAESLSVPAE